ncbi:hypothetical protein NEF87_003178 [Candidatus Lokiarchaeum ossiferum]|uniref:YprB ribonuclease H-like domain-containing protein n=1 Tax=Candidatus Lokiarchaeum ossiferum TaxID=2951803 RepID=A0ABY6HU74_9ARCH|nr:hypothetical protein NEF87_003178 [Candidatus Lokiarchaeum sp. B-35]
MIEHNFQIFPSVGIKTEQKLRMAKIHTWQDVLQKPQPVSISRSIWERMKRLIPQFQQACQNFDIRSINQFISSDFHWQLIPNFLGKIAYLDIETTGLSFPSSHITTIAVYDGVKVHDFVRHKNLGDFPAFIAQFPAIATFYGKGFDVPFIQSEMGIKLPQVHFDLCFLLRRIGLRGGLKKIEKKVGLVREETDGVDGYTAVILWRKYRKTQDLRYLETLLAYNNDDVINLEFLLYYAYNQLILRENIQISKLILPKKAIPQPYHASREIVREVTRFK